MCAAPMDPRKTSGTTSDGSLSDLTFLAVERGRGEAGGKTEGQSTVKKVLRLWARGARAGRGEGGYARASRATAGGGIGSDRPRGNSIETRDEGMARAPCDGRGAREKRPAPHVEAAGATERVREK